MTDKSENSAGLCNCEACQRDRADKHKHDIIKEAVGRLMHATNMSRAQGMLALTDTLSMLIFYGSPDEATFADRAYSFCEEIFLPFCRDNYKSLKEKQEYFNANKEKLVKEAFNNNQGNVVVHAIDPNPPTGSKH